MAKVTIKNDDKVFGVQVFENGALKKTLHPGESLKSEATLGKVVTLAEVELPKK